MRAYGLIAPDWKRDPLASSFRPLRPHPVQRRVWTSTGPQVVTRPDGLRQILPARCRFCALPAGRRSGKTQLAIMNAIRWAISPLAWRADEPRIGFGAPTHLQAKRIYWRRLKRAIPRNWIRNISESELSIELWNPKGPNEPGLVFVVLGLDVPQRVEGTHWDGFVLDEFADMKAETWQEHVLPALATPGRPAGWAWVIGVPNGRNHWWDLWVKVQTDALWCAETWKSETVLLPDQIAALRSSMDARTYRQEMEGSFEEASGRVYYAFDRLANVHQFALPFDIGSAARPWCGGMDFNVDPMRAVWGWEEERPGPTGPELHVHVWDEIELRGSSTWEAGKEIRDRCAEAARFGTFLMHPDPSGSARHTSSPAGQTDHTILRDLGYKVRTRRAAPGRRDRFNSVNSMLQAADGRVRVHIHPRCTALIRDLEGVVYKEGTSEPDEKKCGALIHGTDAFGYWIEKRHRITYGRRLTGFDPEAVATGRSSL